MRHRKAGKSLGRQKNVREAMFKNLATSLVLYEHCNTTLAKAKAIRPYVERLITKGKVKTLNSRRALMKDLQVESAVLKLLEELGPRYKERPGGYTRIIKLGKRQGDGAETAQIQLVK